MSFNPNTYHNNADVAFKRETWVQARDLYLALPQINDDEIKKLVKSEQEIDEFVKRFTDITWYGSNDDIPDMADYLIEFVGEEFMVATRQPQHLLLSKSDGLMERIVKYYGKLARFLFSYCYYNKCGFDLNIRNRVLDSTRRRQDYLKHHPREYIQLQQSLLREGMLEDDFWINYNYSHASSEFIQKHRYIHITRDFPTDKDVGWNPSLKGFWGGHYREWYEGIINAYVRELDMYIDADLYRLADESPEVIYSFMDNLDI